MEYSHFFKKRILHEYYGQQHQFDNSSPLDLSTSDITSPTVSDIQPTQFNGTSNSDNLLSDEKYLKPKTIWANSSMQFDTDNHGINSHTNREILSKFLDAEDRLTMGKENPPDLTHSPEELDEICYTQEQTMTTHGDELDSFL